LWPACHFRNYLFLAIINDAVKIHEVQIYDWCVSSQIDLGFLLLSNHLRSPTNKEKKELLIIIFLKPSAPL